MLSYDKVKYALKYPEKFTKIIKDIANFNQAMSYIGLRGRLCKNLLKYPEHLMALIKKPHDFVLLIQTIDKNLSKSDRNKTFQNAFLEKLISNNNLFRAALREFSDLNNLHFVIRNSPIPEDIKKHIRYKVIEKLIDQENKFLDFFHPADAECNSSRTYSSAYVCKACDEWPEAKTILSRHEVNEVIKIFFEQFSNNNFENYNKFEGTFEDIYIRWQTFDYETYRYFVNKLQSLLALPSMTEPHWRHMLLGNLEICEKVRPKHTESLLDVKWQYILRTDPGFEKYSQTEQAQILIAFQQKSGLLKKALDSDQVTAKPQSSIPSSSPLSLNPLINNSVTI